MGIIVKPFITNTDNDYKSVAMNKKIHYDDNIFFLIVMIRNLHDAVKLNVDADYFANKVLEDCLFIDTTIQKIYQTLIENNHLIDSSIYLHSIMKAKIGYGRLLESILRSEEEWRSIFRSKYSQLRTIAADHLNDIRTIKERLNDLKKKTIDTNITSYDELHFLMSPIEEIVQS